MNRALARTNSNVFATYWRGNELSKYEIACLLSFANRGNEVRVYSYRPLTTLPAGLSWHDAREVVEQSWENKFIFDGKPDTTHFTDYFRYKLFQRSREIWIDTDIVQLNPMMETSELILGKEDHASLCGAIMRIPSDDPNLPQIISKCETFAGKPLNWGDTGPRLLNEVYGINGADGVSAEVRRYFPIHYHDFWKPFSDRHFDECSELTRGSDTLHLWNNLVVKLGLYKQVGPPKGSFLYDAFRKAGCDDLFQEFYPQATVNILIDNFLSRVDTGAYTGKRRFGIGTVGRLVFPALAETLRRRVSAEKVQEALVG